MTGVYDIYTNLIPRVLHSSNNPTSEFCLSQSPLCIQARVVPVDESAFTTSLQTSTELSQPYVIPTHGPASAS